MSPPRLTPLEEELLLDLLEVQTRFSAGDIPAGTIRSKVMYRMAHRRGKTRPAPVHGLTDADRVFKGTFTRTVNRLLSRKLIQRRAVGAGDFQGLPYQWGYARHARRDKDLFLTDEGRRVAEALKAARADEQTPAKPVAEVVPLPNGNAQPRPEIPVSAPPAPPSPAGTSPGGAAGPRTGKPATQVHYQYTIRMPGMDVTYVVTRKTK